MDKQVRVSPAALQAATVFTSDDSCRPNLCSVLVGPNGKLTATDGHRMIQIPPVEWGESEYPDLAPEGMTAPTGDGVMVPAKAASEAAKAGRKVKSPIPALKAVAVSVNGTKGQLASTDLDNTSRTEFRPLEGSYPNVSKVYPTDAPVFAIAFNAEMLAEALKAFASLSDSHEKDCVLTFYSPLKPVMLANADGSAVGLVMPLRMPKTEA